MAHVAEWKKKRVQELTEFILSKPVVGIVSINNIPSPQLQEMRKKLREEGSPFIVSKNTLIKLALERASEQKKGVEKLIDFIGTTQNAIITSSKNAFKLYAELKASETRAPAKGGETAPEDIVVKAGETPFKPGPIVGELQRVGIPAAIESGKVVIKKDKLLVKAGEKISPQIASALTRLEIFPLTVGLRLKGAYEDGLVFPEETLAIDTEEYAAMFRQAASHAFNLSMFAGYPTPLTIKPLLAKCHMEAMNLAVNAGILNKETLPLVIAKAHAQMISLASRLKDGLDEELKALLSQGPPSLPPDTDGGGGTSEEKKEEKEAEEEEVSEEEAAAGLGALFG